MKIEVLPYAAYYDFDGMIVRVWAVLDCRQNPQSIRHRLGSAKK